MQLLLKFKHIIKTTIQGLICITRHINPQTATALRPTALGLVLKPRTIRASG